MEYYANSLEIPKFEKECRTMGKYILKNGIPVLEPDVLKWHKWFETNDRHIKRDVINQNIIVSTFFTGMNYNFDDGLPVLFETMVFMGEGIAHEWTERYTSVNEALKHHELIVQIIQKEMKLEREIFDLDINSLLYNIGIEEI